MVQNACKCKGSTKFLSLTILETRPNSGHRVSMSLTFDHHPERLRRSVLCLPASNQRAIAKLSSLKCDAIILDLEDAVAEADKQVARDNVRAFLSDREERREVIVRVNAVDTDHFERDLDLVLDCEPDALLLPKVRAQDDVLELAATLCERDAPETIRLWAMMETPLAILNAGSIAEAGRTAGGRLDCLVVGLNDLRNETQVPLDSARTYLVPWLMQVLLAARAFGLTAIDAVSNDFRNLAAFDQECAQGRAMGYDGKMLIHPDQIAAANAHFQPSPAEVAAAEAIIAAFSTPEAANLNAINVDGRMVERLHFEQAKRLTDRVAMIRKNS